MTGTIFITGANGSLAIPGVDCLLSKYPDYHLVLTVRNTSSSSDANTKRLEQVISKHPAAAARTSIRKLDLSDLASVHRFADSLASEIDQKKLPPIASIICNAYYWNMATAAELTSDGLEKALQINHVSHFALVLRLISSCTSDSRVVFLGSDAHEPGKLSFETIPPRLPDDLEDLNKLDDRGDDPQGKGFWRYAVSKLAVQAVMHALNERLVKVRTRARPPPAVDASVCGFSQV